MKLTVIIPAHNDEAPLHRLLRHIRQLNFASHVIISDDGSEPALAFDPLPLAAGLPPEQVTLLRQDQPCGAGAARNLALQHVATDHVLFLDADDLPLRELPDLLRDLDGKTFDFCIFQHHDSRRGTDGHWGQMPADQALWHTAGTGVGALSEVSPATAASLCQTANYPWNKIYRTGFLQEHAIRCTEIAVHNDVELHWRSFLNARTILASDRIGVMHYVAPDQGRLTNRNGPERLQVFTALSRVSAELRSRKDLSIFTLPFYSFAAGLLDWIGSFIQPELRPELARQAKAFFAAEAPPPVMAFLAQCESSRLAAALQQAAPPPAAVPEAAPAVRSDPPARQIWLHIGLPKCGSTTIQRHMAAASVQHQTHGVCYPRAWRSADGYRNHLPLAKLSPLMLPQALARITAEALDQDCNRIVLSCEHWANAFPGSNLLPLYKTLQAQLPDWQIRIVAYFRNPYDFVESCYAQYVRAGLFQINRHRFYADGAPSIEKFLSCFEDSRGFPLYSNLRYARMLMAHFPPEVLMLRSIEPPDLVQPDMLGDFYSLLGLPAPVSTGRRNRRVSNRKLAELEYVQTLTDQDSYARLRPQLLDTDFCSAPETEDRRGTSLHISADTAAAVTRQIESERAELQQTFSTGTSSLCETRTGAGPEGWARTGLLGAEDRAQLRAFVARNANLTTAR
ncbi:glycosyltransferase family 2 protein (plasmid) [Leisingera sp. NJS201]|uniref:glycosyltransferase family 2 protein n=1 Tax=Leisingera sp. NJS201 TaxID=2508306 RepID=UPI001070F782|nr:glycosyltransferase family 2 protein [Leisingera sp. NJS201]QBR38542.1 glycosyltransferase family 2 protein [Leisingera sp. NJS201]